MKKSFLLCLMALLGVIGMYAAPTGSGTEADPYLVSSGDTYDMPKGSMTWISFTADKTGTLKLKVNHDLGYQPFLSFSTDAGAALKNEVYGSSEWVLSVEAGMTYKIKNAMQYVGDFTVTVTFEENADAITGTADPATGTAHDVLTSTLINPDKEEQLGVMNTKYPITVTLSKPVGFVSARWDDGKDYSTTVRGHNYDIAVEYERQTSTGGSMGESQGDQTGEVVPEFYLGEKTSTTWNIGPEIPTDNGATTQSWTLYDDREYTLTLTLWNSQLDWEQNGTPIGVVTIKYTGTTPAIQYSTIKLVECFPNPNFTNPKDENLMLSWADKRDQAMLVFDGEIGRVEAGVANGQGMGETPCDVSYIYYGESDGNITKTAVLVKIPEQSDMMTGNPAADVTVNVYAYDKNGRGLDDTDPLYGQFNKTANKYELSFPFSDGRINPTSLNYTSRTPENQYVQSLTDVTLGFGTPVLVNPDAHEMAGLYQGDEKVADIAFTTTYDGDKDTSPSSVKMTFIEVGSLKVDGETGAESGTPVALEEGDYELRLPELVFGNSYISWDTPWTNGLQGIGECNPEWNFKYSIVKSLPEFVSADPAPYVAGSDEYNESLPETITATFSEAIGEATATVRYGMNSVAEVPAENITIDGTNVTVAMPAEALTGMSVILNLRAVTTAGVPVTYGDQEGLVRLTYQLNPAQLSVEYSPASGTTVKSLNQILVTGSESLGYNTELTMSVKDAQGQEVATASVDVLGNDGTELTDWNQVYINLSKELTEAGTYTIEVPEHIFSNLDDTAWNAATTLTYTVDPTATGIDNAQAGNVTEVDVYTVDGALFAKGVKSNEVRKTLPAGVYVVNGRKIAIR